MSLLIALAASTILHAGRQEAADFPLESSAAIVKDVGRHSTSVFVGLASGSDLNGLPDQVSDLDGWSCADVDYRRSGFEFLNRSNYDEFPTYYDWQDDTQHSIFECAHISVLYSAKILNPTFFQMTDKMSGAPGVVSQAVLNLFHGPSDTTFNSACRFSMMPRFSFKDPSQTNGADYAFGEQYNKGLTGGPAPHVEQDYQLEQLRDRLLQKLRPMFPNSRLTLAPGGYKAKRLFDMATDGVTTPLRLDARFWDHTILALPARPLTKFDVYCAIAQALDLYPRQIDKGSILAISPAGPHQFKQVKHDVEVRNYAVDLLNAYYATGVIPSYIPPDAFLPNGDGAVSSESKARLFGDLKKEGDIKSGPLMNVSSLPELDRLSIHCYLSGSIELRAEYSSNSIGTSFP